MQNEERHWKQSFLYQKSKIKALSFPFYNPTMDDEKTGDVGMDDPSIMGGVGDEIDQQSVTMSSSPSAVADSKNDSALAERESQWVKRSKRGVYAVLLLAALATSFGTFILTNQNERSESVAKNNPNNFTTLPTTLPTTPLGEPFPSSHASARNGRAGSQPRPHCES